MTETADRLAELIEELAAIDLERPETAAPILERIQELIPSPPLMVYLTKPWAPTDTRRVEFGDWWEQGWYRQELTPGDEPDLSYVGPYPDAETAVRRAQPLEPGWSIVWLGAWPAREEPPATEPS